MALSGTSFGVDFNPAADRLRIVSDTGQNLRHNVNAGGVTVTDAPLNYAGVTASGIVGSAYTNNDLDALTATTLYVYLLRNHSTASFSSKAKRLLWVNTI